ncbi:MAG: FHA domain-containing protein [Anaerolineae bacterium]|nr:FHA domain-containing protein [Anaerolineae bacterium]
MGNMLPLQPQSSQQAQKNCCPRCQFPADPLDKFCRACGNPIHSDNTATITLKLDQPLPRGKRKGHDTSLEAPHGSLTLNVRGVIERIPLDRVNRLVVGRTDQDRGYTPDFDLSPFGAMERGVSRSHMLLNYEDNKLIATDLGSANGSALNGVKMEANRPYEVKDRDELTVGRLAINVRINLEG